MKTVKKAMGLIRLIPMTLIKVYRKFISPLLPATCKYYPSCSAYALEAYRIHGIFLGTLLTVWRLLRCNPWSCGGVDFVPEKIYARYFVPKNISKNEKGMKQ